MGLMHIVARGIAVALSLAVTTAFATSQPGGPEQQFSRAVEQLSRGESANALTTLEQLTTSAPEFRLGQLIYGELLAALSGKPALVPDSDQDSKARIRDLAQEARVRLASEQAVPPEGAVPHSVLQLAPRNKYAILVDLPRARTYLLENDGAGAPKLVQHHYSAMGKNGARKQVAGDMRTPVGIYHITRWIPDKALPELYGAGALPLDYPNIWDRALKRTGSGIWLHGVPRDTYSRPPLSSEGCVTMANADLTTLRPYVNFRETPVILSDEVEWVPAAVTAMLREEFGGAVERWRKAWTSLDTDAYLSFYDESFRTEQMTYEQFAAHKRRVNAAKRYIEITLSDISLFRYPGADRPLMMAEFTMDYRSSNYAVVTRKQQYWTRTSNGSWKIVREENL